MNKHLKQLIDLSALDKEIDSFVDEEARINQKLNSVLDEQNSHKTRIETLSVEIEELNNVKSKNDNLLGELTDKIKEIEKKSALIKSEKELKALQLEEEIAKEQINHANDEIGRLDKISTEKEAEIAQFQGKIEDLNSSIEEAQKASEEEMKALEKKKQETFTEKDKQITDFPQKLLSFYQKIRRWAGSESVVPVKKQACYGCHMRLNDKIYAEVLKSEEIVNCPHCGRILYAEFEEQE